jgi:NADH:ubiquinone oxidoreductase subunit H
MYLVTKSFSVADIASHPTLLVVALPGIFLGFLYTLEIKFRKSPFDLSCSHHAHQELVRGITTEFTGRTLAMIEIAHWYENVFLLGWVYLFFASMPVLGVTVALAVFVFVILVDNVFARLKWQAALKSAWLVTLVLGFGNILALAIFLPKPAAPVVAKVPPATSTQIAVPAEATHALNTVVAEPARRN